MRVWRYLIFTLIAGLAPVSPGRAQGQYQPHAVWKYHHINLIKAIVTNVSTFDSHPVDGVWRINIEFPAGSNIELLGGGLGPWVGAIVDGDTLVSTGFCWNVDFAEICEFWPSDDPRDSIYVASIDNPVPGSLRYVDDDGDGRTDEEVLNGYDDDDDGLVDEDYGAVSQLDYICQYYDDKKTDFPWGHKPLHLKVIQRVYGWSYKLFEQILFIDYRIISNNPSPLQDLYLGFWFDAHVGYKVWGCWNDDYSYYVASEKMMCSADVPDPGIEQDRDGTLPHDERIGLRVVRVPKPLDDPTLRFSWHWYESEVEEPYDDVDRYLALSDGVVEPDQQPANASNTRCLMGFGPFQIMPGDTLPFTVAIICGFGHEDLIAKAKLAKRLYDNDFNAPPPPPPPKLKVDPGDHMVHLDWHWYPEYEGINPEEFEDHTRQDGILKDFAGYRVYRSTTGIEGPWQLLAEFDKVDGYGYDNGLQYEYTDRGLVNGIRYWYSVVAYDLPEQAGITTIPSQESAQRLSAKMVIPGARAETVGKVAVVPNPYRGDVDYTQGIGWEYPTQPGRNQWYEVDRRIQFINLPPRCTIRIYSLAGELIKTIEHNDPSSGGEYWNLISDANQTIASGIYLFSVEEHPSGKIQVGKFVVIK